MNNGLESIDRLLVDVGNTRIKVLPYRLKDGGACFDQEAWWVTHDRRFDQAFSEVLKSASKPDDVWVSNVAGEMAAASIEAVCVKQWGIKPNFASVERNSHGLKNSYLSLDELGIDRWMAVQGARQLYEGAAIVIGCGTAITVDVVSEDGVFVGGAILPGLELAARSLSQTDGIPQFNFQEYTHALGVSTADCVRVGVINSCAGGIEKVVASIFERFSGVSFKVVASGGAAKAILSATNINFEYDANLVLRGLQRVAN